MYFETTGESRVRRNPEGVADDDVARMARMDARIAELEVTRVPVETIQKAVKRLSGGPTSYATKVNLLIQTGLNVRLVDNAMSLATLENMPPVIAQFFLDGNARVVIVHPQFLAWLIGSRTNACHIMNIATGRTTILMQPAEIVAMQDDPVFVFTHEVGHAFQFFATQAERRLLQVASVRAGVVANDSPYRDDSESPMAAWVEGFADCFGFFYTNDPPGLKGKPQKPLDAIIRRLHNSAKTSRTVDEWLAKLET